MLNQTTFLDQLTKLVAIKTITGNLKANQRGLDYIETLINSKAKIKRLTNQNNSILIAGNTNTKQPDYTYLVHLDVVPGKPEQFKLKQQGDKILGRGVSDMKFSIPLGVALLNELLQQQTTLKFNLVITTDEEAGGFLGAGYLAKDYQLRPKVLIVPDGGSEDIFVSKSKGVCQLNIKSIGQPAHASQPWLGKNALEPLVKLASQLSEKYASNNQQETWATTMNLGQLHGGSATNQICPEAELKIDFRFPETESVETITQEVKKMAKVIDLGLEIEHGSTGLPTYTDANLPIVQTFIKNLKAELGHKIRVKGECGASDARHFAPYKTPILMVKPKGGNIHADSEWLSISSTLKFYQALRRQLGLKMVK